MPGTDTPRLFPGAFRQVNKKFVVISVNLCLTRGHYISVFQALKELRKTDKEKESQNVNIYFGTDYNEYIAGLSKHTRQNIRTAYNRLAKDNLNYKLLFFREKKVDRCILNETIDMYCRRHEERYEVYTSKLKRCYLKYFDFSTKIQRGPTNNIYAVLYINNSMVAFLGGIIDKKNSSAVIPRLSINNEFSKYSPGVILINEVAKQFVECEKIENLDLSKGMENYKLSMGGKCYGSFEFAILR